MADLCGGHPADVSIAVLPGSSETDFARDGGRCLADWWIGRGPEAEGQRLAA